MHLTQSYVIPRSLYVRAFIVLLIKSFHKPFQLQTEFNILLVSLREDFHKKTTTNMYFLSFDKVTTQMYFKKYINEIKKGP